MMVLLRIMFFMYNIFFKFQGEGTYIWSDGRKYEGEFYKGKMQGKGIFTWPNSN